MGKNHALEDEIASLKTGLTAAQDNQRIDRRNFEERIADLESIVSSIDSRIAALEAKGRSAKWDCPKCGGHTVLDPARLPLKCLKCGAPKPGSDEAEMAAKVNKGMEEMGFKRVAKTAHDSPPPQSWYDDDTDPFTPDERGNQQVEQAEPAWWRDERTRALMDVLFGEEDDPGGVGWKWLRPKLQLRLLALADAIMESYLTRNNPKTDIKRVARAKALADAADCGVQWLVRYTTLSVAERNSFADAILRLADNGIPQGSACEYDDDTDPFTSDEPTWWRDEIRAEAFEEAAKMNAVAPPPAGSTSTAWMAGFQYHRERVRELIADAIRRLADKKAPP